MTSTARRQAFSWETLRDLSQRLLELVQQETQILARKDHGALWELLPEKEILARRLANTLGSLSQEAQASAHTMEARAMRRLVKETLRRIEAVNEANGRSIAELLSIHQELLSLLVPQTYGQGTHKALPAIKGCGLSTEA